MAMQHTRQDAVDAAARRKLDQRPSWHPMLAAREPEPGVWYMVDTLENCYGIIRIIRRGGQVGYRAVTWVSDPAERQVIGYYRSLRGACEATHRSFIESRTPGSHPQGLGG